MKINHLFYLALSTLLMHTGCNKILDEKSDQKLVIPNELQDLQALLDNYSLINYTGSTAGEVSADDYYINDEDFNALSSEYERNKYIWAERDLFPPGTLTNDWWNTYQPIYYSNAILDNLDAIVRTEQNKIIYDNVKGQALMLRGFRYLQAASIWCLAYDPTTSAVDLGLPLRLNPDFNEPSKRETLEATYQQIITDLKVSIPLLLDNPLTPLRASKAAAYGLLARAYLAMGSFSEALDYADSCLMYKNDLLDYNQLNPSDQYPIGSLNKEVIFEAGGFAEILYYGAKIPQDFYQTYSDNDLRKVNFYEITEESNIRFKGYYSGSYSPFLGLAVDEVLLTRAECYARMGNIDQAMKDLNDLLSKRWTVNTFIPFVASSTDEALHLILTERRKELLMRGIRWMDLKRFNGLGDGIVLNRKIGGNEFTLPPNDLRYALPIPEDVIALSEIQQNPR